MRDWDDLRFLLAVHRAGSLAKAAAALKVDKATVSRRLTALEQDLRIRIVERVGSGYRITAEASPAVLAAEQIDRVLGELETSVASGATGGVVRLTAPGFISRALIIPALPTIREQWPEIEVQILTSDRLLDLARREADIALRNVRTEQLGLVARKIGVIAYALYASRDYVERRGFPADRAALAGHHLICGEHEPVIAHGHRWLFDAGMHVAFRASDMAAQHDAVHSGLGLGVVPCIVGEEDPALVRVAAAGVSTDEVFATFPEDLRTVHRVRVVIDLLASLWQAHAPRLAPRFPEAPAE